MDTHTHTHRYISTNESYATSYRYHVQNYVQIIKCKRQESILGFQVQALGSLNYFSYVTRRVIV